MVFSHRHVFLYKNTLRALNLLICSVTAIARLVVSACSNHFERTNYLCFDSTDLKGYGATTGQAAAPTGGYGAAYGGTEATGNGGYGASTATGYGTGAADQGGYGAYRGGATNQGRQDRSYRPY